MTKRYKLKPHRLKNQVCVIDNFSSRWFKRWRDELHAPKARHAKFWEQAAIIQALYERGCLKPGKSGIGFGVGREPLPALFANYDVDILASDQNPEDEAAQQWDNGQLADGLKSLYYPKIVGKEAFDKHVAFRHIDMNKLPKDLSGKFDFAWSNCVVGHLGSLKLAENFLLKQFELLKPGGWAVQTTEIVVSSLDNTVADNSSTVVWRLKDLERLIEKVEEMGCYSEPLAINFGSKPSDLRVDQPPYSLDSEHIKLKFSNYVITQILTIFQKRPAPRTKLATTRTNRNRRHKKNVRAFERFWDKSQDLQDYFLKYETIDQYKITPVKKTLSINMKPGQTKSLTLRFKNDSSVPFFDVSDYSPLNIKHLVLGTAKPMNHESEFADESWPSASRPALQFARVTKAGKKSANPHRMGPEEIASYRFDIKAPKKTGKYTEHFTPVLEGAGDFTASATVRVNINVVR